jgi:hypothetical protein
MNKLFIIIFIFLITITIFNIFTYCYYNNKDYYNIINNIPDESYDFYTNLDAYRLGDGFYFTENESKWTPNIKNDICSYHYDTLENIVKKFSGTILSEYLIKANYKQKKYDILLDILNKRFLKSDQNKNIDKSNSVLIHIRLGDIIDKDCNDRCFIKKFYDNQNSYYQQDKDNLFNISKLIKTSRYINSIKYYHKIAKKLKKLGIINIYIICGAHIKLDNYKYSTYYLNEIIKIFESYDFKIYLKIAQHPDNDLLFSMNFNYFVPSYSRYSDLIKDINIRNNSNFSIIT